MKIPISTSGSLLALILILFAASDLKAQEGYISNFQGLNFGDVFIGYSKEILHTDQGAAKFSFYHTNAKSKNVFFNFTLPSVLQNGTDQVLIEFNLNHASWSYNDQISGRTSFDPQSRYKLGKLGANKYVFIWLGGLITTPAGISHGLYTGDIILTIDY
ncbi:MAG: hypothetical protein JW995_01415 [Melioribacteraceae bacterium]|nr:hypothetical protein [Melioribacteraceae bacterium]